MQREIASAVGSEVAKATPTAAMVFVSTVFANDLEFILRVLMYLTAIILAVVQIVNAIKRGRLMSQKPDDTDEAGA